MENRPPAFIKQADVAKTPMSTWYKYTMYCGHEVYTKVRLSFRGDFNEHYIRCPQCEGKAKDTEWSPVEKMEAVTDESVSNVSSGTSFVLPRRILRTDGPGTTSGNPFPYTRADRDY